jgi:dTDP-4-dehydrorhamnose reductase
MYATNTFGTLAASEVDALGGNGAYVRDVALALDAALNTHVASNVYVMHGTFRFSRLDYASSHCKGVSTDP